MKAIKKASHKAGCIILMLTLLSGIIFSGCSLEPMYYSEEEVLQYVFDVYGVGWKFTDKEMYLDSTDDRNKVYKYTFTDAQGMSFSVEAYTYRISIDASTTMFYDKGIRDDYLDQKLEFNRKNIEKVLSASGFDWEIKKDYVDMQIYLDNYRQTEKAAEVLAEIDRILNLKCNFEKWPVKENHLTVQISLKPDSGEEDWKGDYDYRITQVDFSNSESERLSASEVEEYIGWRLAEKVKLGKSDIYNIPDEFLYSYPEGELNLVFDEGIEPDCSYRFIYDFENKIYWIYNLDPCQDFEDFPYNYSDKGSFSQLVAIMGGNYYADDFNGEWTIGEHNWSAYLEVDESNMYQSFGVFMDGKQIELSDPGEKANGTVSGRAFTMEDVEKLLGAKITKDPKNRTCEISYS